MAEGLWEAACSRLKVDAQLQQRWYRRICDDYGEPTRAYHTFSHVEAMLRLFGEYRAALHDETAVLMSIFFHDVVYDGRKSTNEDESAALWRTFAEEAGLADADQVAKVDAWIMQTKHHMQCPADAERDLHFFLDFDLEILGAEWSRYEAYTAGVRKEYAHYSDADFASGRAKVLQSFLAREQLYFTPEFQARCGQRAKENLQRELDAIKAL